MTLEKLFGKIADYIVYAYAVVLLALAIVSSLAMDWLQDFSFSLATAGAVAWIDVALIAGLSLYLILASLNERKTGVRKTKLTAGIVLIVMGAVLVVSFVAFLIAVLANAFSSINPDRPAYDFMDKIGLPLVYLPCIIIVALNIISCWVNFRSAVTKKPISKELDDPNRQVKTVISGVTIGVFTAISAIMLAYYLFLLITFLCL